MLHYHDQPRRGGTSVRVPHCPCGTGTSAGACFLLPCAIHRGPDGRRSGPQPPPAVFELDSCGTGTLAGALFLMRVGFNTVFSQTGLYQGTTSVVPTE